MEIDAALASLIGAIGLMDADGNVDAGRVNDLLNDLGGAPG